MEYHPRLSVLLRDSASRSSSTNFGIDGHLSGEQRMWATALGDAILDLDKEPSPNDRPDTVREKRADQERARRWFADRETYVGSCGWVCEILGIEEPLVRRLPRRPDIRRRVAAAMHAGSWWTESSQSRARRAGRRRAKSIGDNEAVKGNGVVKGNGAGNGDQAGQGVAAVNVGESKFKQEDAETVKRETIALIREFVEGGLMIGGLR